MSRVLVGLLLIGGVAQAQNARPMGETPGDPAPVVPLKEEPRSSAPSVADVTRFSRWSAGRGGPVFAFSQIVDGLVVGGLLGTSLSAPSTNPFAVPEGAYLGALVGGVSLGGLGVLLQYFQPIGLVAAGATALGLGVGALAGLGIASALASFVPGLPPVLPGLLALVGSQVGGLVPLALLWRANDLDPSDLAMLGAGALNAFALTAFLNVALGRPVLASALLLAPALGMAVGGLVAALTQVPLSTVVRAGALPLSVGLALFYLGGVVFQAPQLAAIAALGGMAVTVGVVALVSFAQGPATQPEPISVVPTIVVVPPAPRAEQLLLGPGVVATF